ncbi:MAG: N-acetylmuramoyl-L-alanine amidase [Salinivirgaceae bacterium]|jgi:N-acetylmuramoyl-L-alanine amidase|nr:N-acetylmuramoyl-L-alanine amidase [Salinivirgaceae bacterium]
MKEKILLVIFIVLSSAILQGNDSKKPKQKKVIVIDAGHGGQDTGAVGKNSKEKDIVLAIALKVGKYLEQNMPNVKVIYTRKTDVFIPLRERAIIANNNNADLFVSIHANSNPNPRPYGTETFAMGLHKTKGNLEVAQKENSVIVFEEDYSVKYEGFDPNSAESYIIFSLMQSTYLNESLEVASFVQEEFHDRAKRKDRGVKQAGFLVLWQASMPSILIETGFISNAEEEKFLISKDGQEYLSSAIYRAVKSYVTNLENDDLIDSPISKEVIKDLTASKTTELVEKKTELCFRVQVTSSSKPLKMDHPVFKEYTDVFEYYEKDMYKYTIGKYKKYNEVKDFQQKVKKDFPGAFIVAFGNNERIDLKTAIKLIN